jgi:hypothetical protein
MVKKVSKTALLIGTETAVSSLSSGASLRLKFFSDYLKKRNYDVTIASKNRAKELLTQNYDLIIISSYAAAGIGRMARKRTDTLWFDPYDSWTQSRLSLILSGQLIQLFALVRDVFNIYKFPKREIVSFISEVDANRHIKFTKRDHIFILPIHFEPLVVNQSSRVRLVFVGDGSYAPNRKSLKFLNLVGEVSGQEIHVFGKGYKHQNRFPRLKFHGYVADHLLLWSNDIHLSPIKRGAGIKTKVALPLSMGLRVIADFESSFGIVRDRNFRVAHSREDFMAMVLEELSYDWEYLGSKQGIYERDDICNLELFLESIKLN